MGEQVLEAVIGSGVMSQSVKHLLQKPEDLISDPLALYVHCSRSKGVAEAIRSPGLTDEPA